MDCALHGRRHLDPHIRLLDLSGGPEHAVGGASARLRATLTTLYLNFEKEVEAALGLPAGVHSYALLPIGYPTGRFGPVRRVPLAAVVYEDQWDQPYRDQ
jgi:hypothetical protein